MSHYDPQANEKELLTRFLSWALDARWFPTTDHSVKRENRSALRTLRGILKRMEKFVRRFPDQRLRRGLAEWKSYEETLTSVARSTIRRSPVMQTTSINSKTDTIIATRLLCASLIIARLWNGEAIYARMKHFLADPSKLPYDTANKGCKDVKPVRYSRSEKALQSMVQRMRRTIKLRRSSFHNDLEVLESVYGQYCWLNLGQSGFSDSEKRILCSLIQDSLETQI